jgi:ABC-type lipoprotein export system ATPase subunit
MTANYPKGAEWRIWDLHVHTPASHNYTGSWEEFIMQLANSKCAVIGINDYASVAGYKETRRRLDDPAEAHKGNEAYQDALKKLRKKTLLPVVEFRMNTVLQNKNSKSGTRLNFHVIFSDVVKADDIETFIKALTVKDAMIGSRYDDAKFLLEDVSLNFDDTVKKLNADATFKDKFLLWLPYDEYGGLDDIDPKADKYFKEGLTKAANILGSSNEKQRFFFLCKNEKYKPEEYEQWFGGPKPCIKGSDTHNASHEIGRLKDHESKPTDKYCWIKADPTFEGLKQILIEPEDRVYIGRVPPKVQAVADNKTRYISKIRINKKAESKLEDVWFDCDIDANPEMIAIIGNKGSGKSALADIIALIGNTHNGKHFSFLDPQKFRTKNGRIASQFEGELVWADGTPSKRGLDEDAILTQPEAVKYIPQQYLEKICTQLPSGEQTEFEKELRKVIFSHISETDRHGKTSLDALIAYKTEEIKQTLQQHKQEMSRVNGEIAELERKHDPHYRAMLEGERQKKQKELEAHETVKPAEIVPPQQQTDDQKAATATITQQLEKLNGEQQAIQQKILDARQLQKKLNDKIVSATKLEGKLTNLRTQIEAVKQDMREDFTKLDIDVEQVVLFDLNAGLLAAKKDDLTKEKRQVDALLNEEDDKGLPKQLAAIKEQIKTLQNQLDEPNRRYQQYVQNLQTWTTKKNELTGAHDVPDTLQYYMHQLAYLDQALQSEIETAKNKRIGIARAIYGCIAQIRDIYAQLFAPVQQLIENNPVIRDGFKLSFSTSIIERMFRQSFFDRYVTQGINGSFCGKEAGEARLNEIINGYDFNDMQQSIAFVQNIMKHMEYDYRAKEPDKNPVAVLTQLRKNVKPENLYDFVWSFEYLEPEYSLMLDGKDLNQLSPGERGSLLLVFYLLVDKSDIPIIVDQPEENLDNQTVYRLLIPVIKQVKKRRQIIMVTHNPNIAVVCDAEQVVHAAIDRAHGNAITYTPGSIEDKEINKHIIDVLEGTRPAFGNRAAKYYKA